jgi:hypothetical protein
MIFNVNLMEVLPLIKSRVEAEKIIQLAIILGEVQKLCRALKMSIGRGKVVQDN